MIRRRAIALGLTASSAILALGWPAEPTSCRLVYNPTTSAPTGWYWIQRAVDLKVDDYVLTRLPREAATLANARHYLPSSVPLLKRIGAIRNQSVCLTGGRVLIDGKIAGHTLPRDSHGRNLNAWTHCRLLANDEFFLLSKTNPASFDSRYFGPIQLANVVGKAIPLWAW